MFLFHLIDKTLLYCWLCWNTRWLTAACLKLSHLNSQVFTLDFTWKLRKLRKFSRNWVHNTDNTELQEPSCRVALETKGSYKNTVFGGDRHFYQKLLRMKSLYNRGKWLPVTGWGGMFWGWGDNFSKIIDRGSHRGTSNRSNWTGCLKF